MHMWFLFSEKNKISPHTSKRITYIRNMFSWPSVVYKHIVMTVISFDVCRKEIFLIS